MNEIVRSASQMPQVGERSGDWTWDGARWVCDPDFDQSPSGFFPPVVAPPLSQPPWYPGANGGVTFAVNPPANPVRGHFWWDAATLRLWDGAVWVPVGGTGGAGAVVSGTQPTSPTLGQLWWSGTALFVWDGTKWTIVSSGGGGGSAQGAGTIIISATAPTSPLPGSQWWNGHVLQIWDGSMWQVIGPSAGPVDTTTEVFRITQPTDLILTANAWDILPLSSTPLIDTMNGWNGTTFQFMPKTAGVYIFTARSFTTAAGEVGVALLRNDPGSFSSLNTNDVVAMLAVTSPVGNQWLNLVGISHMNGTSDFVRLFAFSAGGGFANLGNNPVLGAWLMA